MPDLSAIPTEDLLRTLCDRYANAYFIGEPKQDAPHLPRRWYVGELVKTLDWVAQVAQEDRGAYARDEARLGL